MVERIPSVRLANAQAFAKQNIEVTSLRSVTEESSLRSDSGSSLRSEPRALPIPLLETAPARDLLQNQVTAWNTVCGAAELPRVIKLDPKRRAALQVRLKDPEWPALFRGACAYIARHPEAAWMRGQGDRRWKASLDYLLGPGVVEKTVKKARASGTPSVSSRASPGAPSPRRCADADADHQNQLSRLSFPILSASDAP